MTVNAPRYFYSGVGHRLQSAGCGAVTLFVPPPPETQSHRSRVDSWCSSELAVIAANVIITLAHLFEYYVTVIIYRNWFLYMKQSLALKFPAVWYSRCWLCCCYLGAVISRHV